MEEMGTRGTEERWGLEACGGTEERWRLDISL